MTSTNTTEDFENKTSTHIAEITDLLSTEQYFTFLKSTIVFRFVICIIGTWTNVLNIRAFYRMGLKDSVTIVFFSMAIVDCIHLTGALIASFIVIASIFERENFYMPFPPLFVTRFLFIIMRSMVENVYLSTSFLALQRCLCVVKPLHFNKIFSRKRTVFIMFIIWTFTLAFGLLMLVYYCNVRKMHDPFTNSTSYIMFVTPIGIAIHEAYITTFTIVFNTSNQVTVIVCVFVMAIALKKSVRFRKMASSSTTTQENVVGKSDLDSQKQEVESFRELMSNTKERQAIIQVALVSSIFVASNSFRLLFAFVIMAIPGLYVGGVFHNAYSLFFNILSYVEYINSSANFFVYYKYNTKFRSVCFGKKTKT